MSTPVQIKSIDGNRIADVDSRNQLKVTPGIPDMLLPSTLNFRKPLFGYPTLTGHIDGTPNNMNVNGSVTPVDYYIKAQNDHDLYIRGVSILIADTAIVHNAFGNIAALAVGWTLKLVDDNTDYDIIAKAATNAEVITFAGGARPFDSGAKTWMITAYTATEDALLVYIPIDEQYIPGGFRIGMNSNSKLVSHIADDLTGLTDFYVRVFGYRHYLALPA